MPSNCQIYNPFMKHIILTLSLFLLPSCLGILHSQNTIVELPNSDKDTYSFTTSADGHLLYYTNKNHLTVFNLMNYEVINVFNIQVDSPVLSILVDPNTSTLFLGTKSGKLVAVSKETGKLHFEKEYNSGSINALALTSDERTFLIGCENGMVYMQSIEDENTISEFYQHNKAITSIEVSKEKQLIAISSGDGSISLFGEPTYEWIDKLSVGKDWVRKVVINDSKDRLLCVGDDGRLYEWNIANITKARLINKNRVSRNWLLSLNIGSDENVKCWGGLDHLLKVRTNFGTYRLKLKGPVLKAEFINSGSIQVYIAVCILGNGIQIIPLKEMKFR